MSVPQKVEVAKGLAKQICSCKVSPMTSAWEVILPWQCAIKTTMNDVTIRKESADSVNEEAASRTVPGQGDCQLVPLPLRIHWILRTGRSSGDGFSTWPFNQGCFGSLCQKRFVSEFQPSSNRQSTTSDNQETKVTHGKPTWNHPANSSVEINDRPLTISEQKKTKLRKPASWPVAGVWGEWLTKRRLDWAFCRVMYH